MTQGQVRLPPGRVSLQFVPTPISKFALLKAWAPLYPELSGIPAPPGGRLRGTQGREVPQKRRARPAEVATWSLQGSLPCLPTHMQPLKSVHSSPSLQCLRQGTTETHGLLLAELAWPVTFPREVISSKRHCDKLKSHERQFQCHCCATGTRTQCCWALCSMIAFSGGRSLGRKDFY